jgi:hypothetical protein
MRFAQSFHVIIITQPMFYLTIHLVLTQPFSEICLDTVTFITRLCFLFLGSKIYGWFLVISFKLLISFYGQRYHICTYRLYYYTMISYWYISIYITTQWYQFISCDFFVHVIYTTIHNNDSIMILIISSLLSFRQLLIYIIYMTMMFPKYSNSC